MVLSGKIFASGNSPFHVDSKYVGSFWKTGQPEQKTGFRDPGHENWQKNMSGGGRTTW